MKKVLRPLIIIIVLLLICGGSLIGLYTDWLWFKSLDYQSVFMRMLSSKIELGAASGLVFFLIIYLNLWIAKKFTPTEDSAAYTDPITITDTTVLRVRSFPEGQLPSETTTLSYFLRENSSLPIVSLVTDKANLFGAKGIYSNHETAWLNEWEREANVSMYEDGGSFNIDCGIKIHGRTSRRVSEKRSITLKFKGRYGGSLHYDVFGDGRMLDFASLILRASVEDISPAYFRDALFADMALDFTNVPAQNYRYVTLFINGEYWGVYAIREQHSDDYFAYRYGVDPETVEVFNGENRWPGAFDDLLKYAETHNLTDPDSWQYIKDHLDVEEMIDWLSMATLWATAASPTVGSRMAAISSLRPSHLATMCLFRTSTFRESLFG